MAFFRKITSKNTWIVIGIMVLSIMLFKGIVDKLLIKYVHLSAGLILDFLTLLVIVILSKLISEQIFEAPV